MEGIPDTFYMSYQTGPLDLSTDVFYSNRQDAIDTKLQTLRLASSEVKVITCTRRLKQFKKKI